MRTLRVSRWALAFGAAVAMVAGPLVAAPAGAGASAGPHRSAIVAAPQIGASPASGASTDAAVTCPAEPGPSGNVRVNCLAEDGRSPQNTQSETTVAVRGQQIVSAYNDTTTVDLQHGNPLAVGYSVSTDGGAHFVDMGALPTGGGTAFAYSDPSVVAAPDGFWATALAFDHNGFFGDAGLALFHMPLGEQRFHLVSFFDDVGNFL